MCVLFSFIWLQIEEVTSLMSPNTICDYILELMKWVCMVKIFWPTEERIGTCSPLMFSGNDPQLHTWRFNEQAVQCQIIVQVVQRLGKVLFIQSTANPRCWCVRSGLMGNKWRLCLPTGIITSPFCPLSDCCDHSCHVPLQCLTAFHGPCRTPNRISRCQMTLICASESTYTIKQNMHL